MQACLKQVACLTEVATITGLNVTSVETDHEIISMVIFPFPLIQEEQLSYWSKYVLKYWLST